jgi:hypothetical protein
MKFKLILQLLLLVAVVNFQPKTVTAIPPRAPVHIKAALPQASNSISSNEASMVLVLRYILSVEWTFQATTGAGRFGTLQELYLARLIDVKIRTGVNDGYRFVLSVSNPTGSFSTFEVIARPVGYMESGVRTFAINNMGELRVSYLQNPSPAQMQLVTDECASVACTEALARSALRSIHSAEATFQATVGLGRFGTLQELVQNNFISGSLATGMLNGYHFRIRVDDGSPTELPSFEATATPSRFPRTGALSFYIDEMGILRGGYKYGLEADANDDPICW